MTAVYLQIIVGLVVVMVIVLAFIMTIRSGQYDDLDSPAHRILMDDDDPKIPSNQRKNTEHHDD